MKEETLRAWRGWILGATIIAVVLGLTAAGVVDLEQAMAWVEKLLDRIGDS